MTQDEFIFEYLKADQDTGTGTYEKMMSVIKDLDWEKIKPVIIKLKYFYFLRTSYWLIISAEVKRRANWHCSCGGRENLQAHHTEEANKHHGEEHLVLDKLECLCGKCHDKIHNNSVKDIEKKRQRHNKKEEILTQLPYYPLKISEEHVSGSSVVVTRKLLEELEHDRKVIIDRNVYEGWLIQRT